MFHPYDMYRQFTVPVTCNGITYIGLNEVHRSPTNVGRYLVDSYGREVCAVAERHRYAYAPPELKQRLTYISPNDPAPHRSPAMRGFFVPNVHAVTCWEEGAGRLRRQSRLQLSVRDPDRSPKGNRPERHSSTVAHGCTHACAWV